ncbi:MAG: hypothetical protein PHR61_05440 [Candidatus Absconditabacteria bacterium]|nr:hypothetical protein [Candidatus Absconditabacteria bacterium]
MFEDFSPSEIQNASKTIYEHILRDFNIRGQLKSSNSVDEMPKDLRGTIFYQETFEAGNWNNCDLTDVSGNGTLFRKNDFYQSLFNNVSMQYCNFSNDIFQECNFSGSNFANSTFAYCAIQKGAIYGCSFVGTEFYSGIIRDISISSSTFELCHLRKMLLEDLDLRQLTLNYTFFENVIMKNVCLPFIQIPYTFNGLQYVFSTNDSITISSHNPNKKKIELDEYKNMITDFTIFFNEQNQYFPLVNCYIVQKKIDLAIECNETGLIKSASLHDFRSLYFYCIQASQILKISREKRMLLYSKINSILSDETLYGGEYHQFYLYFPRIKQLLFDTPNNNPAMTLTLHTNIEPDDYNKLSILLSSIEQATRKRGIILDSKHIEIRHNSPNIIDFFCSGQYQQLVDNLQGIYCVLEPIITDLANIITIGGVAWKGTKILYNEVHNKQQKKKESTNIKKLREEINQRFLNNGNSNESPLINVNIEKIIIGELIDLKEYLKKTGIQIMGIDIQFLDGKEDPLDNLYHHSFY